MNKVIAHYLAILISVIDLVIVIFAGVQGIMAIFGNGRKYAIFNATQSIWSNNMFRAGIWFGIMVLGLMIYPVLSRIRQRLRDEVEYDEDGISKARGKFSQLSYKERLAIERQLIMDRERVLPSTQLKAITHAGVKYPEKELDKLIGLDDVKQEIKKLEARMAYEAKKKKTYKKKHKKGETSQSLSSNHMIFIGSPGTGKTTMARIITSLLYKYGYIRKNQSIEIDGNFFTGLTHGESSKKTLMLLKAAKGGVLFIDEAYSLLSSDGGQDVIATIVKEMEDQRGDLIIILAGYPNEMKQLINSNPGIESRVKNYLYFKNYNEHELGQIFTAMANEQNLVVSQELLTKAVTYIIGLSKEPNYGNARTVRNVLDKIIDKHAMNIVNGYIDTNDIYRLMPCDMI